MVAGSTATQINNVYFGKGKIAGSPTAAAINGTGGSGSNVAGASLDLCGGKGTGTAVPGEVRVRVSTPTGSGSTLQTLANVWRAGYATGAARVIAALPASAPADADLQNNEFSLYLDGSDLKAKRKDGSGTVTTATLGTFA
jgi:hypothetical protein